MRMLGNTQSWIHLAGELLLVGAGAWGLYLRFVQGSTPVPVTNWFGPLALLATGLLIAVAPLGPARNAAWIHGWIRPQVGLASLLWSFAICGCLYSLWLQYNLQFSIKPVLLLAPGFLYWFAVSCPGRVVQQRNIDNHNESAGQPQGASVVEEVRRA